jgi:hypothetical protein
MLTREAGFFFGGEILCFFLRNAWYVVTWAENVARGASAQIEGIHVKETENVDCGRRANWSVDNRQNLQAPAANFCKPF